MIGLCDFSYAVGGGGQGGQGPGNFIHDYCCIKNIYICILSVSLVLADQEFISSITGGRGYGGPMQPGVFHGYPLKSPKLQGVI